MMKRIFLLLFTIQLFIAPGIYAAVSGDAVTQPLPTGEINWTTMTIRAKGKAEPLSEEITNRAVAALRAERSAKIAAVRNIVKTLHKVRLSSSLLVEDLAEGSEYVSKRLARISRGAAIVERTETPEGGLEVTVEAPISSEILRTVILQTGSISVSTEGETLYTGLIVDARGLGLRPALSPRVLDASGNELYGSSVASMEEILKRGLITYRKELSSVMESERTGDNPYVVKGLRISHYGNSDVVLSAADAQPLKDPSKNLGFLLECRVIFIVD